MSSSSLTSNNHKCIEEKDTGEEGDEGGGLGLREGRGGIVGEDKEGGRKGREGDPCAI